MSLLKNYFNSLFRNALRDKFFALLNLLGLAVGITASILIFIYIQDQVTFDKHNINYDRIYRLESDFFINEKQELIALVPLPMAPTLKDEYPEIEEFTRILRQPGLYFEKGESSFKEDSIAFADSTVFKVFSIPFINGDPQTALRQPYTIVISASMARKYFGTTDVIGESMKVLNGSNYTIEGVFEDMPENVHLRLNGFLSNKTIEEQYGTENFNDRSAPSFWNVSVYSYILMAENTTTEMVQEKFPEFYDKYMASLGQQIKAEYKLRITPLVDVHFQKTELQYDMPKGNMNYVYIMGIIGLLLIVIASINYTNLTTARATNRAREIGIRKVGGAGKKSLRSQFLGESVIMALAAGIVAALITILVLPLFNNITSKSFDWQIILQPGVILFILGISLFTGLLSGLYPSFYLASFNPVTILKGNGVSSSDRGWLRKGLVVVQFLISAVMVIGSIIIALQMRFIQHKDLGFDSDNILLITLNDTAVFNNVNALQMEIERHPDVEGTSLAFSAPGGIVLKNAMTAEDNYGEMQEKAFNSVVVDYDYIDVLGISMAEGRFYSKEFGSDITQSVVVNEALVRDMQWGDHPIGKRFIVGVNIEGANNPEAEVIGVVKDYNYGSLHNPIDPLVFVLGERISRIPMRVLQIKVNDPEKMPDVLSWIADKRDAFNPAYPIQYSYLKDELDELYQEEHIVLTLVISFTILIIFIASLGLLGLVSYMTVKRTRETGIRRVMGASQNQILYLFLTQFSKWVIISNVIAWPLSYLVIKPWLQDFTYRINFPYWTFIVSLLLSLVVALLTVSWQSLKASRMNPASSIRVE